MSAAFVPPPLLVAFDALAHTAAVGGLSGCIALGVRRAGEVVYWVGRYAQGLSTEITLQAPARLDASLVLDEADADDLVATGFVRPGSALTIRGDRRLLARLLVSVGPAHDLLSLRAARSPT